MKFRCTFLLVAAAVMAYSVPRTLAQTPTAADVAAYSGPDRTDKLIAGAKREGTLTVYTSARASDMAALAAAFEKKYGVKVGVWRASSENILQRAVTEARGGRSDVDVFETGSAALEALHREQLLQKLMPPDPSSLTPAAVPAHGEWTGTRLNLFVAAYNTNLVKQRELPKSYDDFLDARWKGRLGIETADSDWFGAVVEQLGEQHGLELFRNIVAKNGISVRKGHTLLANLVVSGEVPLALTVYSFTVEQLKKAGAPIAWVAVPPTIARFEATGVARRAPHPNAAVLFYDFLLTDAQGILASRDIFTASRTARPLPEQIAVAFIDPGRSLDENRKWSKYYRDIVVTQAP